MPPNDNICEGASNSSTCELVRQKLQIHVLEECICNCPVLAAFGFRVVLSQLDGAPGLDNVSQKPHTVKATVLLVCVAFKDSRVVPNRPNKRKRRTSMTDQTHSYPTALRLLLPSARQIPFSSALSFFPIVEPSAMPCRYLSVTIEQPSITATLLPPAR